MIGLAIVVVLLVVVWWVMRPRPRCPECGGYQVGLTSKEPQGMTTYEGHSNSEGGGYITAQVVYEVTYRCSACGAMWSRTITESS